MIWLRLLCFLLILSFVFFILEKGEGTNVPRLFTVLWLHIQI